jgi:hypothetical protein
VTTQTAGLCLAAVGACLLWSAWALVIAGVLLLLVPELAACEAAEASVTWLQSLRETRASIEDPRYPLTSQALVDMLVGPKSDAGSPVNERSAFAMPAVYRAIALIAGHDGGAAAARLPGRGRTGSGRRKPTPRLIETRTRT